MTDKTNKQSTHLPLAGILFDLDGTLVDTAPDLIFTLNTLLDEAGLGQHPYETIRPLVSHGATAMICHSFELAVDDVQLPTLLKRFLDIYQAHLTKESRLFPGMDAVLDHIEAQFIPWGIVTNKPQWLTDPLLKELGLDLRAASVVCGDTTTNKKPHPEPMWLACEQLGVDAQHCVYIGDAQRDIEAGVNAGMTTIAARYGYLAKDDQPEHWGADQIFDSPLAILDWLTNTTKPTQNWQENT